MKLKQELLNHLSWFIIAICILQIILSLMLRNTNEAFAWIIAAVGWIAYKIET